MNNLLVVDFSKEAVGKRFELKMNKAKNNVEVFEAVEEFMGDSMNYRGLDSEDMRKENKRRYWNIG